MNKSIFEVPYKDQICGTLAPIKKKKFLPLTFPYTNTIHIMIDIPFFHHFHMRLVRHVSSHVSKIQIQDKIPYKVLGIPVGGRINLEMRSRGRAEGRPAPS